MGVRRSINLCRISDALDRTLASNEKGWCDCVSLTCGVLSTSIFENSDGTSNEFVGQWVRLREDSTWGDTLNYLQNGRVLGSTGHDVPQSAQWGVRDGPSGTREFCAADEREGYCETFRFEGEV